MQGGKRCFQAQHSARDRSVRTGEKRPIPPRQRPLRLSLAMGVHTAQPAASPACVQGPVGPRAPLREPWPAAVEHAGAALAALQLRESVFPQSSSRPVPGSPLQLTHLNVAAAAASDCLAGEEAEGLLGRHRCPYTRASGAEPTCSLHACAPAFNPT